MTGILLIKKKVLSILVILLAVLIIPACGVYSFTDKFVSQTNLELVESNGDLVFEGFIQGYTTAPIAIQGDQTAALNRLTVKVKVKFTNKKEPEHSYENVFTQYQDYESSAALSSVEEALIVQINEALVEDIFNKAVVNW